MLVFRIADHARHRMPRLPEQGHGQQGDLPVSPDDDVVGHLDDSFQRWSASGTEVTCPRIPADR